MNMKKLLIVLLGLAVMSCNSSENKSATDEIKADSSSAAILEKDSASIANDETEQADDCVFDQSTQTEDFMKLTGIKNYSWDAKTRTATKVTENGDTLKLQRGGCDHYTVGVWKVESIHKTHSHDNGKWISEAIELGEYLKDELDLDKVKKAIQNKKYDLIEMDNGDMIQFHDQSLVDMNYTIERSSNENQTEIGIFMYMN